MGEGREERFLHDNVFRYHYSNREMKIHTKNEILRERRIKKLFAFRFRLSLGENWKTNGQREENLGKC